MAKRFTLGKTERLKSRKAMEELFEKGERFSVTPFRIIYRITGSTGLRFAVGVSTRNFKKAVHRNTIRRKIREAYRLQHLELKDLLHTQQKGMDLFFTYTAKELPDYSTIAAAVEKCLNKLLSRLHENLS